MFRNFATKKNFKRCLIQVPLRCRLGKLLGIVLLLLSLRVGVPVQSQTLPAINAGQAKSLEEDHAADVPFGEIMNFSDEENGGIAGSIRVSQYQKLLMQSAPGILLPTVPGSLLPQFSPNMPWSSFGSPDFQPQMQPAASSFLGAGDEQDGVPSLLDFKDKPSPQPTVNVTGQLQADFVTNNQDANNLLTVGDIPEGAFFRRSRFGVFGEAYERVEYRFEYEFASAARPRFLDNWVALTDVPLVNNIIIGHFFEPFSLERYSPNRFITFTERSLGDTFAPQRNMGVMIYGHAFDDRLTWALGGFRDNSDDYGTDLAFNEGYAVTAHSTVLPWYEEIDEHTLKLFHLGYSYSYRLPSDNTVQFATRPSARLFQQGGGGIPVFTNTGVIDNVDSYQLGGLEAAWVHGSFSVQSEYMATQVNRDNGEKPYFHGGYVYGSWFLTGESRSYSPTSILGRFREGIFQRTVPRSNFFYSSTGEGNGGWGAVELAVRYSYIDLNSLDIRGGSIHEMTYGVNWYWNPNTKLMFNYVEPRLKDPDFGGSQSAFYVCRMQFEF